MPKILNTKTQKITTERTIKAFGVTIPDNGDPCFIEVHFSELDKDEDGQIVNERTLPPLRISQVRANELLPSDLLPSFSQLYQGLSSLFHTEYDSVNSPPQESQK